ncbi:MAG: twin-arginine translocase subunit TatB [Proteobacteria bacterium]|nr:MAG: twin-arginine translocase subunit TatB [Pseudomonadota bacterium]
MFGIGPMELLVIAVVAVVFVGPEKLPDLLKKFGKFYVQAKRHANDVKSGFDQAIHEAERDLELDRIRELQKQIHAATLADVIDAKHTDHTVAQSPDGIHTADGRLLDAPAADAGSSSSAMPPEEIRQNEASYHEGHLPAHTPKDDHDPFGHHLPTSISSTAPGTTSAPGSEIAPGTSTAPGESAAPGVKVNADVDKIKPS